MAKISKAGENSEVSKNECQVETAKICNENANLPKNPLLYLFVQCVWDPRHGPCYGGQEYIKLENWLKTADASWSLRYNKYIVFQNSDGSLFCTIKKPRSTISYADFQRKTQDTKDMIILTHVAYHLRGMIKLLNLGKEDVIYKNRLERPLLPAYLCECRDVPVDASEHEISIVRKVIKRLIEMGAPLYTTDCYRDTPFRVAAMCKNHQILQTMVSSLAGAEGCDEFGNTALHTIAKNCVDEEGNHKAGYVDLVRTLVSKGANVNAKNSEGVTPVHFAAENFQVEMMTFFADEGAKFDERTDDDKTALQFVCKSTLKLNDQLKIIEAFDFLVSQGCDFGLVDKEGHTLLHLAAEFCHGVQVVERLIALGVSVDCRTAKTLLTPLYLAAKSDKMNNMRALVRAGADVNAEAADGSTPIFMSALVGSYKSMQFLIDHGADLHRRDTLMGFSPLHMAANAVDLCYGPYRYRKRRISEDGELKKLEALLDKGLDVNDAGSCGVTPLHLVILAPNVNAVKFLLDRGANVNFQTQWTALELALMICDRKRYSEARPKGPGPHVFLRYCHLITRVIHLGVYSEDVGEDDVRLACPIKKLWLNVGRIGTDRYLEILSVLIDHGADVNVQNALGKTPLHHAVYYKDGGLEVILEAGAHVNVQDNAGTLPVHKACSFRDDWSLKMMLDFGADINDDDTSHIVMKSREDVKNAAIEHSIKRKLIGLPIAKAYEPFVDSPEFADFHEKCSKEAVILMSHRDADDFSFYDFLRMNPKFQYHYINKITRDYKNLEQMFPMYVGLIRGAWRESAIRRQLLEPARIVWAENTDAHLPDVCVEHILSYLSNRYLKVMTTIAKAVRQTSADDKKVVFEYLFKS